MTKLGDIPGVTVVSVQDEVGDHCYNIHIAYLAHRTRPYRWYCRYGVELEDCPDYRTLLNFIERDLEKEVERRKQDTSSNS